jgi:hypothetical protein
MNKNQDMQSAEYPSDREIQEKRLCVCPDCTVYPSDREILAAMVSELTAECIRLGVSITYVGDHYGDGVILGCRGERIFSSDRFIYLKKDDASKKINNWIKKLNAFDSRSELLRAL